MGGNALKVNTRRINLDEYQSLKEEITDFLNLYGYEEIRTIPHIFSKKTFGDLDLLVSKPKLYELDKYIYSRLGSKEVFVNGDVISFEYKNFQIDLIHCSRTLMEMTQVYFSYNDLGMIMGILAKRLGCKYGTNGLSYVYHSNFNRDEKFTIPLTKDPQSIFEFLGLDFNTFLQGFYHLEDVFDYIQSSYLYDSKDFINHNLWNHRRRKRNLKRTNWQKFLKYIDGDIDVVGYKPNDLKAFVQNNFPEAEIEKQIDSFKKKKERKQLFKQKFNGDIVMSLVGLKGKELGKFMSEFKSNFGNFEDYIISNSIDTIYREIKNYYDSGLS